MNIWTSTHICTDTCYLVQQHRTELTSLKPRFSDFQIPLPHKLSVARCMMLCRLKPLRVRTVEFIHHALSAPCVAQLIASLLHNSLQVGNQGESCYEFLTDRLLSLQPFVAIIAYIRRMIKARQKVEHHTTPFNEMRELLQKGNEKLMLPSGKA